MRKRRENPGFDAANIEKLLKNRNPLIEPPTDLQHNCLKSPRRLRSQPEKRWRKKRKNPGVDAAVVEKPGNKWECVD